jgi:hypothetical protein
MSVGLPGRKSGLTKHEGEAERRVGLYQNCSQVLSASIAGQSNYTATLKSIHLVLLFQSRETTQMVVVHSTFLGQAGGTKSSLDSGCSRIFPGTVRYSMGTC